MKVMRYAAVAGIVLSAIVLSGCSTFGKQNVGIAAGGVSGALVGSAISGGSGIGIAAGAIGGALAGNAIAKDMNNKNNN